jgi:hypothetical protein
MTKQHLMVCLGLILALAGCLAGEIILASPSFDESPFDSSVWPLFDVIPGALALETAAVLILGLRWRGPHYTIEGCYRVLYCGWHNSAYLRKNYQCPGDRCSL